MPPRAKVEEDTSQEAEKAKTAKAKPEDPPVAPTKEDAQLAAKILKETESVLKSASDVTAGEGRAEDPPIYQ